MLSFQLCFVLAFAVLAAVSVTAKPSPPIPPLTYSFGLNLFKVLPWYIIWYYKSVYLPWTKDVDSSKTSCKILDILISIYWSISKALESCILVRLPNLKICVPKGFRETMKTISFMHSCGSFYSWILMNWFDFFFPPLSIQWKPYYWRWQYNRCCWTSVHGLQQLCDATRRWPSKRPYHPVHELRRGLNFFFLINYFEVLIK